nr:RNA-binding protein 28 isoform X2 [Parasteatoda tepidariorum]
MQAKRKKHLPLKIKTENNVSLNSNEKQSSNPNKIKDKNKKTKKRKRLIIRNLSFQVSSDELQETFSKFGNVVNVNIPLKEDGRKKGFAFVEFEDFKSLIKAMKALNNKEIHGRRVAIDYAVDKTNYQLKLQSIKKEKDDSPQKQLNAKSSSLSSDDDSEEEKPDLSLIKDEEEDIDEDDKRVNEFLKEFDSGIEAVQDDDDSDESSESEKDEEDEVSGDEDEEIDDESDSSLTDIKKHPYKEKSFSNKKHSDDISEGKTVFIRNVSFATTKESLRESLERYGDCEYCLICVDPVTEHSKGTAFVKFKSKASADKLLEESMKEPGILVDGRKLTCSPAVSKESIFQQKDQLKKPKDRRNLRLLKVGLILPHSEESKAVSPSDMAKRAQLERLKNQKLKNVNFFVSDKRLMVHNLPKTLTDVKLRKIFKDAAGKGAVVTEARVMRDFKKTSVQGIPLSRGFGFVSFSKHEEALEAIGKLNNNPKIFTTQKRPIVEFSVENKVALLTKERRREKLKQRNKRRSEEKSGRKMNENVKNKVETSNAKVLSKKTKKRKKISSVSEEKERPENTDISEGSPRKKQKGRDKNSATDQGAKAVNILEGSQISTEKSPKKKQRKKNKSKFKKKTNPEKSDNFNQETFKTMVDKFKEKLLNKM